MLDTRAAGPAQGFVALAASRTVRNGSDLETVLKNIKYSQKNVGLIVVPDTLSFLAESGRVKEVRKWVYGKIRLYPILTLENGRVRVVGLKRTKKKAVDRMIIWLDKNLPKRKIAMAFIHTDDLQEAISLNDRLERVFKPTESYIIELTPVIGAHIGPGMIGVA